jgi:hypothetical protein
MAHATIAGAAADALCAPAGPACHKLAAGRVE